MIVLGGELSQTGDICLAAIREGIYGHAQPLISRDISIVRSRMGRSAGLVGAAAVAVTELFAPAFLRNGSCRARPLPTPGLPICWPLSRRRRRQAVEHAARPTGCRAVASISRGARKPEPLR